jgi:hypothetical protein
MYTLEPYKSPSSRHTCPSCGAKRQFARYINTETSEYLADHVGRCNREQSCSYHYTPKQYFHDHPEIINSCQADRNRRTVTLSGVEAQIPKFSNPQISTLSHSLIPDSIYLSSLSNYKSNHFITFLSSIFDPPTVTHLINTYFIGTSKNWPGSVVFWQIDYHGNIRDGKIMLYDPTTGRRIKQPYNHITWAHSALKLKDYNLQQCFFGEHLLNLHPTLPVSIVESEKTAVIASVYFPQFIWIATGGKHGCKWSTPLVYSVLKGRHINLWPDIKAYNDWHIKALELSKSGLQVTVSSLLEQVATETEREAGLDISDYLIRFKPYQFNDIPTIAKVDIALPPQMAPPPHSILPPVAILTNETEPLIAAWLTPISPIIKWDLDSIESSFKALQLPQSPFRLNEFTVIHDLPQFISGHLSVLRTYNGNTVFIPYLQRIQLLHKLIKSS